MTQHNHTTAEKWLRNAPADCDRGRTVTDEQGRQWGFHDPAGLGKPPNAFFYCVDDDDEPYRAELPPGTYALNYREGLEFNAEEAWEYLAGGEERRCFTSQEPLRRLVRVRDGQAEALTELGWGRTYNGTLNAESYTIAPDEPAGSMWTTPATGGPIPEAAIDPSVTPEQVAAVARAEAQDRCPCCEAITCPAQGAIREARERVAELEGRLAPRPVTREWLVKCTIDEMVAHFADLEAKLTKRHVEAQNATSDYMRVIEERDAAIAERDKLRAEVKANAERLDTWRGQSADIRGALNLPHDAEWETVFRVAKRLHAEVSAWRRVFLDEIPLGDSDPNDATFWPAHWCNHEIAARAELERLRAEVDDWKRQLDLKAAQLQMVGSELCADPKIDPEDRGDPRNTPTLRKAAELRQERGELIAEVERLELENERLSKDINSHVCAIDLPTDTTTPLDIAQRAVALMGGRELLCRSFRFRMRGTTVEILDNGEWRYVGREWTGPLLWDDDVTIALAPEPEPERRRLTFAEACLVECPEGQAVLEVAVVKRDNQRWILERYSQGHIRFHVHTSTASWFADFAPWMLAAEWEACS